MLTIHSLAGNTQSLDGGAMFGNAPQALWSRWYRPDARGRINLACRCFLVDDGTQKILVESGVGAFFPPEQRERYGVVEAEHILLQSLFELNLRPEDIDVVLLSHLHFDHAGGILAKHEAGDDLRLVFQRAKYVVSDAAFRRAKDPHPRDRASYIPGLVDLLVATGRLHLVFDGATSDSALGPRIHLTHSQGHTPGLLLPTFLGDTHKATFCADLVPGQAWVHLPMSMGYDRFPELLVDEKKALYEHWGVGHTLLFTHDPHCAAGALSLDERGRYTVVEAQPELTAWDLDAN